MSQYTVIKSPLKNIICITGKVIELNKSALGSAYFAFLGRKRGVDLLYYKKGAMLHDLVLSKDIKNPSEIDLCQWSDDGRGIYFLEYYIKNGIRIYYSVFIDWGRMEMFRLYEPSNYVSFLENKKYLIQSAFSMDKIRDLLAQENVYAQPIESDKLPFFLKLKIRRVIKKEAANLLDK